MGQEVNLVRVGGGAPPRAAIPEEVYDPQVLESMHLVSMAADFQTHDYRHFGCIYNPDDLRERRAVLWGCGAGGARPVRCAPLDAGSPHAPAASRPV